MIALLCTLNARFVHSSLALYSLKAQVRDLEGQVDFRIREFTINRPSMDLLSRIHREKPDRLFLGLYIWNREETLRLVRDIHRIHPQLPVYLGGPEATHDAPALLRDEPAITGIFMGEAEDTFRSFWLARLSLPREQPDPVVPGLMVRNHSFQSREPLDPGALVFAYPPEALRKLENHILYYEASRGCPFHCAYCLSSVDRTLRFKPLDQVVQEIQALAEAGVRQVKFVDRTFNVDPRRAVAVWKAIFDLPADTRTNFHFEVTGDRMNEDALRILAAMPAGRVQLEIGVQSCTPEVLERCGRKTDIRAIERNVRMLKKPGNVHLHLDLIAGLPGETPETFARSFNRVWAMGADQLQLGFLKVLRGSPMEQMAPEYGIRYSGTPPYEVLGTDTMDFDHLCELKQAEGALETVANSGLMPATMGRFPVRWPQGPLAFFQTLGQTLDQPKTVSETFLTVLRVLSDREDPADVRSHLLFDWLLAHRHNTIPAFLAPGEQRQFWLEAVRSGQAVQALGTRYPGMDGRRMYKELGAMTFETPVYWQGEPVQTREGDPVVFDYKNRLPGGFPEFFCTDRRAWDSDPENRKGVNRHDTRSGRTDGPD